MTTPEVQQVACRSVDSTNSEVLRVFKRQGRLPLFVTAQEQTAGRGRHQRTWFSPPGCGLYCSYADRAVITSELPPRLMVVSSLAVARALARVMEQPVAVKWPNDIMAAGGKLGGILNESKQVGDVRLFVMGIGINVAKLPAFPHEPGREYTYVNRYAAKTVTPALLANSLLLELQRLLAVAEWRDLLPEYRQRLYKPKGPVAVMRHPDGCPFEATILDVDDQGNLLVDASGVRLRLLSGEILKRV